jgi:hypothetical protein
VKRKYSVFVDSFSGAIADLPSRLRRDPVAVLCVLEQSPLFSVFDATEHATLARTLDWLKETGKFTCKEGIGFPWHHAVITEKGRAYLLQAAAPIVKREARK